MRPERRALDRPSGVAWTTTFADLAALLLAFFVLVFSMSSMDRDRWDALSASLNPSGVRGVLPTRSPAVTSLTAPRVDHVAAEPAGYVETLLRQRLQRSGVLVPYEIRRDGRDVVLRLGAVSLGRGEALPSNAQGRLLLATLSDIIGHISNSVEIRVHVDPDDGLERGLLHAHVALDAFRRSGYPHPMAAFHLPDPDVTRNPVWEIVIHPWRRVPTE